MSLHTCTRQLTSSIGKTTFVNTLCGRKILESKDCDDASNAHLEEGVSINPVTVGMLKLMPNENRWG